MIGKGKLPTKKLFIKRLGTTIIQAVAGGLSHKLGSDLAKGTFSNESLRVWRICAWI